LQDVFHDTKGFEILDENLSNIVNEQFCEIFPITLWNRIYWEVSTVNQMELNEEDISQIPYILESLGFNASIPVYIFWGYGNHPFIRTKLTNNLLGKIDEIIWFGSDLYIFCPTQRYVIEFFHDDSINIGWMD
jgi:hypothetical protein